MDGRMASQSQSDSFGSIFGWYFHNDMVQLAEPSRSTGPLSRATLCVAMGRRCICIAKCHKSPHRHAPSYWRLCLGRYWRLARRHAPYRGIVVLVHIVRPSGRASPWCPARVAFVWLCLVRCDRRHLSLTRPWRCAPCSTVPACGCALVSCGRT